MSAENPPSEPSAGHHSFWLWVMCLTGVDYFSTLGYIPSIAYNTTGNLAPLAMILLVLATLLGALPIYAYVASRSPHGMGSVAMLERLVSGWTGKILVLVLLGFAGTAFIVTKTLSAADAAVHLIKNPLLDDAPTWLHSQVLITMFLLVLLGATFLRGFREVIGVAVVLVSVYLVLNAIIIVSGLLYMTSHSDTVTLWQEKVATGHWEITNPLANSGLTGIWMILGVCLLYFPRLALGLSGFETGLMVMPLIKGDPDDEEELPKGRIRNTRKLLITAAVIMSVFLLGSSTVTTILIPADQMLEGGNAADRALAYIAHGEGVTKDINPLFGEIFGTIYDLSSVVILWFAGASAMAGLLNLIPQYLPRYGMAPEWARATRPLIIVFTIINLGVTWLFDAGVEEQSSAYATGILVFLASGCIATLIDRWKLLQAPKDIEETEGDAMPEEGETVPEGAYNPIYRFLRGIVRIPWFFGAVTLLFLYATAANVIAKPDGLLIALCFIGGILVLSFISRIRRSKELRFQGFEFVDDHSSFLWDSFRHIDFPVLVPHRPGRRGLASKEDDIRKNHRLTSDVPIVFLEVELGDVSEFYFKPLMEITQEEGRFILRVTRCASIAHVIAAIGLELSKTGRPPEIHFGWSHESPLSNSLSFVLFGQGNVPWLVRELIQHAQPETANQPRVIIG